MVKDLNKRIYTTTVVYSFGVGLKNEVQQHFLALFSTQQETHTGM